MKQSLINICKNTDFKKVLENKGYAYFTKGSYNLNIIGIRTNNNSKVTNVFDDALVVIFYTSTGHMIKHYYPITTEPGKYYMNNPESSKGTAIMVPGQYRGAWSIGLHKGKYRALCQRKPIKVYRDSNKDNIYDLSPEKIDEGIFGINIHKAGESSTQIDKWSAGCQVFAFAKDFIHFMTLCQKQVDNGIGTTFTYTLLNEAECC